MNLLDKCIKSLRDKSGKPQKFAELQNKVKGRFTLLLAIDVGKIRSMIA